MLLICHACLRTDRKLHAIHNTLSSLYDELIDFGVFSNNSTRFCSECTYKLVKINEFKKQCKLASQILTKWKKRNKHDKEALHNLSTKMPSPRLGYSNKNNSKIYTYKSFQHNTPAIFDTTNSKDQNIVNITADSLTKTPKLEQKSLAIQEPDEITASTVIIKQEVEESNDKTNQVPIFDGTSNITYINIPDRTAKCKNEAEFHENEDSNSGNDLIIDQDGNSVKTDNDSNDDDIVLGKLVDQKKLARIDNSTVTEVTKVPIVCDVNTENDSENVKRCNGDKISKKELKENLVKRFITYGELTDEDGKKIDTDVILSNLKNMQLHVLRELKNKIAVGYSPSELTPDGIKLLANLHKKYSIKESNNSLKKFEEVIICKNDNELSNFSDDDNDINDTDDFTVNDDHFIKGYVKTDNDSSDDELIAEIATKKRTKKPNESAKDLEVGDNLKGEKDKIQAITDRERRQKISKEELKRRLVKAFRNCGELKDEEGSVINTDLIINSLDDMALRTLRRIKNQLVLQYGKRVLTPRGITLLSQLQKKFTNEYSNGFTVEHLPTRERMLEEFSKRQHYEKYKTAAHKCELCYTAFRSNTDLENHIKNCHNEKNRHVCKVCNVRLSKESSLHWHLFKHRTVYKCKLCPFISYQKGTMITHYNQHKGVIYTCDICNAKFKSRSGHYMHMNKFHETKYSCNICEKAFVSEYGLKFHHSKKHKGQDDSKPGVYHNTTKKKYYKKLKTCPLCSKREPGVNALKQHFKADHPSESFEAHYSTGNNHLCHVCGKAYQSAIALREHKNIHTGLRPYSCDSCGASFAKKGTLKSHVETHMPPTKECQICGKKFRGATNLMNHMLYHKPPSKECQMCGKMFSTGSNLYNHMKRHLGDRRYKCDICSKTFLDTSSRNEHVRGVHNHIRRVRKKRPLFE